MLGIQDLYGADYGWDRCAPLSEACEAWFVAESCFYECDVNAGRFRRHVDCAPENEWELFGLPLKGSDCHAWYDACKDDVVGIPAGGSYWEWWGETAAESCVPLSQVYTGGEQLCNLMFGDAFVFGANETEAFTLKPVGAAGGLPNVNDFVETNHDFPTVCSPHVGEVCHLQNAHTLEFAAAADAPFSQCQAWEDNACCSAETTLVVKFGDLYGPEYDWNRCAPLSAECESWFVA